MVGEVVDSLAHLIIEASILTVLSVSHAQLSMYTVYVVTLTVKVTQSKSFVKYSSSFTVSYDSNIHFSAVNYICYM